MNSLTTTPLPQILAILESIAAALRSSDLHRCNALQGHALGLLKASALDCGDRMIIGKVVWRIRKVVGGLEFAKSLETLLAV